MIAVGEHLLGPLENREIRMTTGFAAGKGYTYLEGCGAFFSGVMIIGGLYGRISAEQDDELCQALVAIYRERFLEKFNTLKCADLRAEKFGSQGEQPCSVLVEQASSLLLDVIDEYEKG